MGLEYVEEDNNVESAHMAETQEERSDDIIGLGHVPSDS